MAPSFFKDFGKPAKDALSKNFDFGDKKVEVASAASGVNFKAEWSAKAAGKLESVFALPRNAQLTVESDLANLVTGTFKAKEVIAGGTFIAKANTAAAARLGFEYVKDKGAFSVEVDHSQHATVVHASALVQQAAFVAGGSVQFDANQSDISQYELGLGYVQPGVLEATAKLSDQPAKAGGEPALLLQFVHFVSPSITFASKYSRSFSDSPKSACEFGGVYALSDKTQLGLKLNNAAQLGMHALHHVTPAMSVAHSLCLNVNDPSAPHGYGVGFKLRL